uniref:Methyltransferase type 11 domain-containing protein n=1 Tax=Amphimedon queenslandica TaxID=400682 RepID=A0A1X7UNT6_AMPQE
MASKDYEDYNKASKDYDSCRQAVGIDVILGAVARVMKGRSIKEASIVDIGCGTGNYAVALSPFVGNITGIEYNKGMMEQATKKTEHLPNVKIMEGSALSVPLEDRYCDVVICTHVLHHLSGSSPPEYAGPTKAISEVYRILKDEGAFVINTLTSEQLLESYFMYKIVSKASERLSEKYPPVSVLHDRLSKIGFRVQSVLAHCHESIIKMDTYLNVNGPLDPEWRNTTSIWAAATPEELEESLKDWRKKIEDGTAQQFIDDVETVRKRIGQTTTIVAYKGL